MGENTLSPEKSIDFKATISKPKETKSPKGPTSGAPLVKGEDGLYYDKYTGQSFEVNEKGKVIEPPKSPTSGAPLVKGEDGFYRSEHDGGTFIVNQETGKITTLKDPMSGGVLIPNENGTFFSESVGKNFTFYNEHFIPLYIPDDTGEPAHIENGKLIGEETGRSFEIDEKGRVLTPQEIEYQRVSAEETEKLATALKNAEEEVNQSILENMVSLGQSIENAIKESRLAGETNEQLTQKIKNLREQFDKQLKIVTERYYFKLDHITQVLEPEPTLEPEIIPEPEPEPNESIVNPQN